MTPTAGGEAARCGRVAVDPKRVDRRQISRARTCGTIVVPGSGRIDSICRDHSISTPKRMRNPFSPALVTLIMRPTGSGLSQPSAKHRSWIARPRPPPR